MYDFQHTLSLIITRVRRRIKTNRIDLPNLKRKRRALLEGAVFICNLRGVTAILGCEIRAGCPARVALCSPRVAFHFQQSRSVRHGIVYLLAGEARWPANIAA